MMTKNVDFHLFYYIQTLKTDQMYGEKKEVLHLQRIIASCPVTYSPTILREILLNSYTILRAMFIVSVSTLIRMNYP